MQFLQENLIMCDLIMKTATATAIETKTNGKVNMGEM